MEGWHFGASPPCCGMSLGSSGSESSVAVEFPPPGEADPSAPHHKFEWHGTGRGFLTAKLHAIEHAQKSIRLEVYIFSRSEVGERFRDALLAAVRRGVEVFLMIDAVGSAELPKDFFAELDAPEIGTVRRFNKLSLETWSFRDHRKILVVDEEVGFVGGCNIGTDYFGDGVDEGWRDGGIVVRGPVVDALADEFDAMFAFAEEKQWRKEQRKDRKHRRRRVAAGAEVDALFVYPGFGRSPLRDAMRKDLAVAKDIAITSPYFLPTTSLRHQLTAPCRRKAKVRILLAGKSDVVLMQLASRSIYRRLMKAGVEIWEYQPQVLHAKILVLDDVVYIGSSNLDPRSLRINFEVMLRIEDPELAAVARQQFEDDLQHATKVTPAQLHGHRTWWNRLKQRFAYWVLAQLDPRVAESKLRRWVRRHGKKPSSSTPA